MNDKECLPVGFVYEHELVDADGKPIGGGRDKNIIPRAGINMLIRSPFGDSPPIGDLYLGLFRNNALPSFSSSAADIPSVLGEFTNYEAPDRPLWDKVYDGEGTYSNADDRAVFDFLSDQIIYGAFMVSVAEKGATDGLLLSAVRFSTPRTVQAGTTLRLGASLTYISVEL